MAIYLQIFVELNSARSLPVCDAEEIPALKAHRVSGERGSLRHPVRPPQPSTPTHTYKGVLSEMNTLPCSRPPRSSLPLTQSERQW